MAPPAQAMEADLDGISPNEAAIHRLTSIDFVGHNDEHARRSLFGCPTPALTATRGPQLLQAKRYDLPQVLLSLGAI